MAVNLAVEPFDVEFLGNWEGGWSPNGGTLSVSFFGHEIWTKEIKEGDLSEYDLDHVKDAAMQSLGELIAGRLMHKVVESEYGGIQIV